MVNYLERLIGDFDCLYNQTANFIDAGGRRNKHPLLLGIRNAVTTPGDRRSNYFANRIGLDLNNMMDMFYGDIHRNRF